MELLARNATVNRNPIWWKVGFMDRILTYNVYGQVLSHTDGKGQTTRLMRTARGLPSSRQDAMGQRVRYEYDKAA